MELIVTRHGESTHNVGKTEPTFAGNKVDSELTPNGRAHVELIAEKINSVGNIDVIYHSTMTRSRQTAEIIQRKLTKLTGKTVPIKEIQGLHEMDGGEFTGKTQAEIRAAYPVAASAFYDSNDPRQFSFPGGEDFNAVEARAIQALQTIRTELEPHHSAVIVAHANLIKILNASLQNQPEIKVESHTITIEDQGMETEGRGIKKYSIDVIKWQ